MRDERLASATHADTGVHYSPFFPSVWSFASSPQQPQPRKFPMLLTVSTGEIVCPAVSSLSMAPAPH